MKTTVVSMLALAAAAMVPQRELSAQTPLGTGFTYQGQLKDAGGLVNDTADFQFSLWDDPVSTDPNDQVGSTQTVSNVNVVDGLFTVQLNGGGEFGPSAFNGEARWLQIAVRVPAGAGGYTTLSPRQELAATPYALYALEAESAPWSGLTGVPAGFADGTDDDLLASLSCASGEIAKFDGLNWVCAPDDTGGGGSFWSLTGNAGTDPNTNFLGTTDNVALELHVNGTRALRIEPDAVSPNLIGGNSANVVTSGVMGATIAGGGYGEGGPRHRVTDDFGTIGGGGSNQAGNNSGPTSDARYATVAGGEENTAYAHGFVGGGKYNTAGSSSAIAGGWNNSASGDGAAIGGGSDNYAMARYAFIGGGSGNTVTAEWGTIGGGGPFVSPTGFNYVTDRCGTIGGGGRNQAGNGAADPNDAPYATVGGGFKNQAAAAYATIGGGGTSDPNDPTGNLVTDDFGTIGGGRDNQAGDNAGTKTDAEYATVPGGRDNTAAGNYSFAAGRRAKANHDGAFVWADSTDADFTSQSPDTFNIRASGGTYAEASVLSSDTHVIHAEFTGTGGYDAKAVYGKCAPADYYGFGGYFEGGAVGAYGGVQATGNLGYYGLWGTAAGGSGINDGVLGEATGAGTSTGVAGIAGGSGTNYGVYGYASGGTTNYSGYFEGGAADPNTHVVHAEYTGGAADAKAVYGKCAPADWYGYGGYFEGGYTGAQGSVTPTGNGDYRGLWGSVSGGSGINYGVLGWASGSGTNHGVHGYASGGVTNYAGYFDGDVHVTGTLTAGAKPFKIDHPLDPANKYLYHTAMESPDMMNVYNGNVVTDADGQAWVELPDYFEALNSDFRYQLTVIGRFAQAIVASEIKDNRFAIRTDKPKVKVSWQVTGIRQDPFAEANRVPVEEVKREEDRGYYLHPEAWGQPAEMGIDARREAKARKGAPGQKEGER